MNTNTNKSLNFNHYLYVILYFLDFFTTWLVVSKLIVKYKDCIFPKALVNALGSSFPPFVIGFIWFINLCYIVILTETIFYLLKKEKYKAIAVLLWVLFSKDILFIVLRLIEKYNL